MGAEATCTLTYAGETAEVKALLETDELITRGPVRLKIPLAGVSRPRRSTGGSSWPGETSDATLELGPPRSAGPSGSATRRRSSTSSA